MNYLSITVPNTCFFFLLSLTEQLSLKEITQHRELNSSVLWLFGVVLAKTSCSGEGVTGLSYIFDFCAPSKPNKSGEINGHQSKILICGLTPKNFLTVRC